ncbi:hypothetical protein [Bradyrhizobium forestalis]|nr:hypothetical protein [Bradyrhizobium forestalis]
MTKRFEQKVARDLWGDARTAYNAPTRRKRERRSHIAVADPDDRSRVLSIPATEYPAGFVFYQMGKAGLLQGLPEQLDLSAAWRLVVVSDDKRRAEYHERHPGKLALQFRHVPDAFGRLLCKIAYCQVLTALDPGDFRPICLPFITGARTNLSFVVGSSEGKPEPENGYSLSTMAFGSGSKLMLIAQVRLYANTSAPTYHVVVGDVSGRYDVGRVVEKLGPQDEIPPTSRPWFPDILPLPFWTSR